jgi:alkylation response protein AidB-like acyl-CoA dehydrogenase
MATAYRDIGRSLETDPFRLDDELTDAERAYWRTARDFVDDTVLPVISGYQDKLVRMLADLTAMQLYCLRLGRLIERRRLTPAMAALAKLNNTRRGRELIATARESWAATACCSTTT